MRRDRGRCDKRAKHRPVDIAVVARDSDSDISDCVHRAGEREHQRRVAYLFVRNTEGRERPGKTNQKPDVRRPEGRSVDRMRGVIDRAIKEIRRETEFVLVRRLDTGRDKLLAVGAGELQEAVQMRETMLEIGERMRGDSFEPQLHQRRAELRLQVLIYLRTAQPAVDVPVLRRVAEFVSLDEVRPEKSVEGVRAGKIGDAAEIEDLQRRDRLQVLYAKDIAIGEHVTRDEQYSKHEGSDRPLPPVDCT